MYTYLLLFLQTTLLFNFSFACEDCWKSHWQKGLDYYSHQNYLEASNEMELAIEKMTDEEQILFPFVFVDLAENNYLLQNYSKVIENTEKALESANLTEYERLNCGLRRVAVFMKLGQEENAVDEYKKHIIGCPLFPKYNYFEEKIIIRNVPDCDYYKELTKERMLSRFCTSKEDIHEYGNTWIINVNKKNDDDFSPECHCKNFNHEAQNIDQITACCNTCNKLATAASFICGCLPIPGGPITAAACKFACVYLVEDLRQECERCCYNSDGKCWKDFETWKQQFKKQNPGCGCPPVNCS